MSSIKKTDDGVPRIEKPAKVGNPPPKTPGEVSPHGKRRRLPQPPEDTVVLSPEAMEELARQKKAEGK